MLAGNALGWVLLEVLAALAVAIGIVWWTFPREPKAGAQPRGKPGDEER
jgi:hypothetical protein